MTSTLPRNPDVRECRLYRYWVAHPVTGERVLGYIGETGRLPFARLMEHVMSQPWADTTLAWEVDPTVYWGKRAVLVAERAAIEAERPLYNDRHNDANPRWVDYDAQVLQRHARDRAQGFPPWQPGARQVRRRTGRPSRRPRVVARPRRAPRSVREASPWALLWLALFVLVAWRLPDGLGWSSTAWVSAGAATSAVGVLLPRRRRRRARSMRRWV